MKRLARFFRLSLPCSLAFASICQLFASSAAKGQEYLPGIKWEEPPVVTPGMKDSDPPSDAIVLFGGKNLDKWEGGKKWKIENGEAVVGGGAIATKQKFGDCQLHVEWSAPQPAHGSGQGRGNSGVFFGPYEFQVLDSYQSDTYREGQAASVYKQTPPWVNAMRPPGEWNTYDIIWTAPKFDDNGKLKSPAYLTALHNGVLVQNHFELLGTTDFVSVPHYDDHGKLPIRLQDHGNPVRFRNIWIREIKAPVGKREHPPSFRRGDKLVPVEKAKEETADNKTAAIDGVIERVPRWERWKIDFDVDSIDEFAKCLDQHEIMLGVIGRDNRIYVATELASFNPIVEVTQPKEYSQLGRTLPINQTHKAYVQKLAERSEIEEKGNFTLLFFPWKVEETLYNLEYKANSTGDPNKISQTNFKLAKKNGKYEFVLTDVILAEGRPKNKPAIILPR